MEGTETKPPRYVGTVPRRLCKRAYAFRGAEVHTCIRIRQEGNTRNTGCDSCGVRLGAVGRVDGLQVRESASPKVRVRRAKALIEVKISFTRRASADDVQRMLRRCLGKGV